MNAIIARSICLFIGLCIATSANAAVVVSFGNMPYPRERIVIPGNATNCKYVSAGFRHGKWVSAYRVCYARHGHVKWVSGHYECTRFNKWSTVCKKWVWVPSYWTKRYW